MKTPAFNVLGNDLGSALKCRGLPRPRSQVGRFFEPVRLRSPLFFTFSAIVAALRTSSPLSFSYGDITRRRLELEYFLLRSSSDVALRSKRGDASFRTRLSFNGGRDRGSARARFRGFIYIESGFFTSFAREQKSLKESVLEISTTATPDSREEREGTVT